MRGKIYPMDTLWIRYRGFSAAKNGPHPGENRPNFDICTVFAVKKGNICTKQRHRNNRHARNNVHEPQNGVKPGFAYIKKRSKRIYSRGKHTLGDRCWGIKGLESRGVYIDNNNRGCGGKKKKEKRGGEPQGARGRREEPIKKLETSKSQEAANRRLRWGGGQRNRGRGEPFLHREILFPS